MFQSPRSGKFESNFEIHDFQRQRRLTCFNPLDRGNLNQMYMTKVKTLMGTLVSIP